MVAGRRNVDFRRFGVRCRRLLQKNPAQALVGFRLDGQQKQIAQKIAKITKGLGINRAPTGVWNPTSTSSHKWETYRRRRFGRFSRRRATSIVRSVRKERATQKIGQSAIGPPGWLEKGPSASLLVRHVSQRIRSSLAPGIQTLLKPTVCLPLMRRCTRWRLNHICWRRKWVII